MAEIQAVLTKQTINAGIAQQNIDVGITRQTINVGVAQQNIDIEVTKQDINTNFDRTLYINSASEGVSKLYIIASQDIGIHRIVATNSNGGVIYADNNNLNTLNRVLGLSLQSVSAGGNCIVLRNGEVEDQSFNFTGSSLYVGSNGMLTTTPPTIGYLQKVGDIISPTRIYIEVYEPLKLGV